MKRKSVLGLLLLCSLLLSLPAAPTRACMSAETQLIVSCTYGETVDISEQGLTEQQLEELFYDLQYEGKLPWYTSMEYTYYYDEYTGLVLEFEPILLDESYDRMAYEQAVATILDACILEGMADWQKVLALYDYLALHSVYDETYELDTGYDLLINGSTICSGYAALYQDLLLRLGIPCLQVDSDAMDHVWNLVQLEGSWYHVDVTWADPTPDTYGLVDHDYFLLTDHQIGTGEDPHYDWVTDITCTDTRFEDAFWAGVYSPILFTDSDTCYYLRDVECRNSLYCRSISQDKETRLYQEKEAYKDLGYGKYTYFHTGLFLREGRLWLCTMDQVISMALDGTKQKTEYTYEGDRYISGCYALEDTLLLSLSDHEGDAVSHSRPLSATDDHLHSFTQTVTAATCAETGYTTAVCDCGLTATGDPKAALGHTWEQQDHQDAGLLSEGFTDSRCTVCGETEHLVLSKLTFGVWIKKYAGIFIPLVAIPVSIMAKKSGRWKK